MFADGIDLRKTRVIAVRVSSVAGGGTWPPDVVEHDGWSGLYDKAARGLAMLDSVADAVQWANDLVQRIKVAD